MKQSDTGILQLSDLRVVLGLIGRCTLTKAAEGLGMTQSALGLQLERMRQRFGDPLFVRASNRMAATSFNLAASDQVSVIPLKLFALFLPISAIKVVRRAKVIPAITIRPYWHPRSLVGISEIPVQSVTLS
jgi:hypothetical protein